MSSPVPMEVEYPYEFESFNKKPVSTWPTVNVKAANVLNEKHSQSPQSTAKKEQRERVNVAALLKKLGEGAS